MNSTKDFDWDEKEYLESLQAERHMYAWVLQKYGNVGEDKARKESESFYKYERPEEPCRGLVFHDLAWHWAMLKIFGEGYWRNNPSLEKPSKDYEVECDRYEKYQKNI